MAVEPNPLDALRARLDGEAAAVADGVENAPRRDSQASEVVKFVRERCDMAHDENSDVYAIDRETREVRHIERRAFRNWVQAEYYDATQKSIRTQSYSEAVQTLAGIGRHKSELVEVHIRCAAIPGGYVIDLAQPGNSRAILVEAGKWRIVGDPAVLFVRPESLKPLPEPVRGGGLAELWTLINVPKSTQLLVVAWLIDCLRPDTPFPLLELIGEQGAAKSVTQTLLRKLIDPSTTELRSAPKNSEDVFIGAGVNWLLAYDNVSHLSADLQDTLCRVATGATYATRRLYTNSEESTIRAKRPLSINGISAGVTAQDLVDRTISIELTAIEDRRERGVIEEAFTAAHGRILGGLLDIFADALSIVMQIQIPRERRPRLIEYARLGCAVAEATGHKADDFLTIYEAARQEMIARTIDASPVATALIDFFTDRPDRYGEYSIKHLFRELDRPEGCDSWPKSPKGFADALRRAAPALRTMGISTSRTRKSNGQTLITVSRRNGFGRRHSSHSNHLDITEQVTSVTSGTSSQGLSRAVVDQEVL